MGWCEGVVKVKLKVQDGGQWESGRRGFREEDISSYLVSLRVWSTNIAYRFIVKVAGVPAKWMLKSGTSCVAEERNWRDWN